MLLYRGFNNNYPNMGVRPNQKGIWMTDDEEYANEYAMLFKNGAIAEIDIDDDANIANVYDCEKVFEDDEDIEDIGEYLADLGGDIEFDNQVCNKLLKSGYDGLFFDDYGNECYYIFNKKIIKEYNIIKTMENNKEDAMESFNHTLFNGVVKTILKEDIESVKKYFPKVPSDKIQTLIALDPTYKGGNQLGKFGKWILGLFNKGQLKEEDFYKVTDYLKVFSNNFSKMPNKDIMSYKTLPDLAKAIQPFEGQKDVSKKQEVRDIKNNEAKKVLETSKWIIITPKTHKAACYYGANTKWCTASKEDDTWFDNYNMRGPLYILINKESNEKYQVHFESLSFMNELDQSIIPNDVFKDDKKVYEWFLKTIDKNLEEIFSSFDELFNSEDYGIYVYSKNRCELELDLYDAIKDILRTDNNEVIFEPEEISEYIRDTSRFWNTVVPNYLRTHDDFEEKCNKLTRKYTNEEYYLHKINDSLYFIDEYRKELIEKIDEKFNSEYIQYIWDYLPEVYGNYEIEDECMFISINSSEIINLIMKGYDKREIKEKLEKKYAEYAYEDPLNYGEIDIRFQKEMEKIIFQSIKDWTKSDKQTEMKLENTINDILKNAGVKLNESLDFYTSVKDSYGDELHCRMTVSEDGKNIGYLDFSVYEDTPYIQMINVKEPYRRKGYATQMIKQLQKEYPNSEINFGMTTDDGTKLVNSLPFDTKVNIEYDKKVKQAKKLKKWLDEFKEFTDKVYQQIDNNEPIAEKNRLYIVNNTDKWQKYKNKYEEILDWIRENKREKKFVKINEVKNLNEAIFFNDEVFNDWNDSYEQLTVILNPSIEWLRNQLNKPHCYGFRFLHNTQDNLLYVWDCKHSFTHMQVFDIVDMKWGKDGTNVVGIFDPKSVLIWEALSPDGYEEESIKLAKKLDGKLFDELYPDGYEIGICY